MALSQIQIAIDTMATWASKINLGFTQTDANEADIGTLNGEMDAAEARLDALDVDPTGRVTVNEAAIAGHETRISDNETDIGNIQDGTQIYDKLQLNTAGGQAWSAGQLSFDALTGTLMADTYIPNVRANLGQETYVPVYNGTGSQIDIGTPVAGDQTYTAGVPNVVEADADVIEHYVAYLGCAAHNIPDGTTGFVTHVGAIPGVDTSGLAVSPIFLASGGGLTTTPPAFPGSRLLLGGCSVVDADNGVIGLLPVRFQRAALSKNYFYTSQGITADIDWAAGFYDFADADANLTQASTTQTFTGTGSASTTRAAHAGIVPSGPGTVSAGQVGLRVYGTLDSETGPQSELASGSTTVGIITDDITTLTANTYFETSEKFSGEVTFELYEVVTVGGMTYSLDFNYGFAKYEDFANNDFTLTAFEAVWRGGGTDPGPNITVFHHTSAGWTYAASGFTPGGTVICDRLTDQAIDSAGAGNVDGAYKRVSLNQLVLGEGSEGIVIRVVTNANATYQTLNMNVIAVSEELR